MSRKSWFTVAVFTGLILAAPPFARERAAARAPALEQAHGGRRAPPPPRAPRPPNWRPAVRGQIVFVGGYFYDPFFGPYPWWPRPAYPFWYHPIYDDRAELRIVCPERQTAVYVDGFYAGIVDDFDGAFQRLPLPPGGHRITLYLEGFVTKDFSVYLRPDATFTLRHAMEHLVPGEVSVRPTVAPPVPAPPEGTYTPPRGMPPAPPGASPAPVEDASQGTAEIDVQPANAAVVIDGVRWMSSDPGRYELLLPSGPHRLEVSAPGYRTFTGQLDVRPDETTPLSVSLVRGR